LGGAGKRGPGAGVTVAFATLMLVAFMSAVSASVSVPVSIPVPISIAVTVAVTIGAGCSSAVSARAFMVTVGGSAARAGWGLVSR